jgi:serine/threonine-protein kinase
METTQRDMLLGSLAVRSGHLDATTLRRILDEPHDPNGLTVAERIREGAEVSSQEWAKLEAELLQLLDSRDGAIEKTLGEIDPSLVETFPLGNGSQSSPRALDPTVGEDTVPLTREPGIAELSTLADDRVPAVDAEPAPVEDLTIANEPGHVLISTLSEPPELSPTRYTLSHVHAKGGVGQVWLARDSSLGRDVALKELRHEKGDSPILMARFVEEARITGQLEHPGIVPVYELGLRPDDKHPFYTMRFVRGRTVSQAARAYHAALRKGEASPVELTSLLGAFVTICNTIAYAHARGVIHRDIKPQNVVFGDFGEVIVLDWGLAKLVDDPKQTGTAVSEPDLDPIEFRHDPTREPTLVGEVIGTPAYMAPEQAAGDITRVNQRTDVYGLGAILYEILTGRPPFERCEVREMLRRVREDEPDRPSRVAQGVAPALEAITLKALRKNPEERYESAKSLATEVSLFLADEPVDAYPEPWTRRLTRWAKRHRSAVAAAALLLATTLVGLTAGYILVRRERDEAARQREHARNAVDEMYTQVAEDWLADHIDTTQRHFLERALAYYDGFAGEDSNRPDVRLETGRALQRAAVIQHKLGKTTESDASFQRALAVLEPLARARPGDRTIALELARTRERYASLLTLLNKFDLAQTQLDSSLAALQSLARNDAADFETTREQARAQRALGDLLRNRRENAKAVDAYRQSVELLTAHVPSEPSAKLEFDKELGRSLSSLGLIQMELDRIDDAESSLRRAVSVQQGLLSKLPTLPYIRENLAIGSERLSRLEEKKGRSAEAEKTFRLAIDCYRRLVDDFPDRPELRRTLIQTQNNLATLQTSNGDLGGAGVVYRDCAAQLQALHEQQPDVANNLRDLATVWKNLAAVYVETGHADFAHAAQRAVELADQLVTRFPDKPDHLALLAESLLTFARAAEETQGPESAIAPYERAQSILANLVKDKPDYPPYLELQAQCLLRHGFALAAAQKTHEAETLFRKALALFEGSSPQSLQAIETRQGLALVLGYLADLSTLELPERLALVTRAVSIYEQLELDQPQSSTTRTYLAASLFNLGEILELSGNDDQAASLFARAADKFEDLTKQPDAGASLFHHLAATNTSQAKLALKANDPTAARSFLDRAITAELVARKSTDAALSAEARKALAEQFALQARTILERGETADILRLAMSMTREEPENPEIRVQAARLLARAAVLIAGDMDVPAEERTASARSFSDSAVAQLRVAVDSGLSPAAFGDETDFATLSARDDFRALVQTAPSAP